MLQRVGDAVDPGQWNRPKDEIQFLSLRDAVRVLVNYWMVIAGSILIALLAAGIYLYNARPLYTAQVDVLIETNLPKILQFASPETIASLDTPQVESQIAIVKSERVADRVVERLGLDKETVKPEEPDTSLMTRISEFFLPKPEKKAAPPTLTPKQAAMQRRRSAIASVQGDMDVRRQGLSYSMQISYSSSDPETAAFRANAVAEAYIQDQVDTRMKAAEQGSQWLERRIEDLRLQMNAAALTVQQFKARRDYRIMGSAAVDGAEKADDKGTGKPEQVTLEELESRAETYRKIFESYLAAYAESVQRQSYPVTNARIITPATPPSHKSRPRTLMTLAAGGIIGALSGLGLALILNAMDTRFRSPRQVREELGIECLGLVSMHDTRSTMARRLVEFIPLMGRRYGRRRNEFAGYHLSEVSDLPLSRFSRSIRSVRKLIDVTTRTRPFTTLGVTSAMPGEGKTTFVANLARLYAMLGSRVLLVDADVVKSTLTNILAPDSSTGLLEVVGGQAPLASSVVTLSEHLSLLPMSASKGSLSATELLTSNRLGEVIATLKDAYDVILFDLPPMRPVGDAVSVGAALDAVVLAVRWSETPSPLVADVVDDLRRSGVHPIGAVLTMALDEGPELAASGY